ncbi:MAG: tRNA pseudouridine synthase A [Verrucomicrobiae bacterium]|nr:tRNA pseudouridine synthase A [Verrucomicrobiae bacterium]
MKTTSALIERRYKLTVAYDGTAYGGWQRQSNQASVQELIEGALAKLVGQPVSLHGSGRTDAGVHARAQVASVALTTSHPPLTILRALNANLPADVRVTGVRGVAEKFHARFSATGKEYRYQIDTGIVADPFLRRYAWHHPRPLDVRAMRRAAKLIVGRHDFSALSANPMREIDTPVRHVTKLTITQRGNLLTVTARADGFLYKMVRSIVGALVKVGEGRMTVEELRAVMAGKKRTALVETAPAHGLFLWRVFY